jgi:hypothetical protein
MEMEKEALRVGEKWLPYRKAAAEHIFTVHSVFNRVINISTDQGLLSVATEVVGGSSSFLTIPGGLSECGIEPGDQCVVQSGRMRLAKHSINFQNSVLWKGPIPKNYRHNKIKKENITAFKAVLDRKAPTQSAWKFINNGSESRGLKYRFSGLGAIRRLRKNPLQAQNLIGLGQGLTPAGDDMLTGFLAIVNHLCEDREYVRMLHGAVSGYLHKTTDISAQTLVNALDSDYHEYMQKCIRDLCEGEKESVYISAASLLGIGATSGSDIACGMYFGMSDKEEVTLCSQKQY